jgi:hypothetical protein
MNLFFAAIGYGLTCMAMGWLLHYIAVKLDAKHDHSQVNHYYDDDDNLYY